MEIAVVFSPPRAGAASNVALGGNTLENKDSVNDPQEPQNGNEDRELTLPK